MSSNKIKGIWAENLVLQEYLRKGYFFIDRNVQSGGGELDLIFQFNDHLTFVEVRYLRVTNFMHPVESVGFKKLLRLRKACQAYYQKYDRNELNYNLDIATVSGATNSPSIEIWTDVLEG